VAPSGSTPRGLPGQAVALAIELWLTAIVLLAGSVVVSYGLHGRWSVPSILVTLGAIAGAGTLYGALRAAATPPRRCSRSSAATFAPLLIA